MKLKKIAQECREHGSMLLIDHVDAEGCIRQWIGSGAAFYPVEGLPYLQEEHLQGVFELTDKQCGKMRICKEKAPEGIDFGDTAEEMRCADGLIRIIAGGHELRTVWADGRARMILESALDPILIEHKNADFFLRRTPGGSFYIAVKEGLLLVGIVFPSMLGEEARWELKRIGEKS